MAAIPAEIVERLAGASRVVIAGHVNPDADCLGSMGGLCLALRKLGRKADVAATAETVSRRLRFLLEEAGISPISSSCAAADLAVVLDTAKAQRINLPGEQAFFGETPILNIDHHATNPRYGRWNWVDSAYGSTAEMVYDATVALGVTLDASIATLLYAGIHADTMGFSLPTTTPSALAAAVRLAQAGARIGEVCERMHRSRSRAEFELHATIYRNTRVSADGTLAWSSASAAEMAAAGASAADVDDQVEVPRSIEGISIAMLFTEVDDGKVRINFRGESGVNVLKLAEEFGGGGHVGSAGARMRGELKDVIERVTAAARRYLAGLQANS